ncbi:MAG: hypothetical protein V3U24_05100 [Candidatus Neomarinimicrobiota bacterium]
MELKNRYSHHLPYFLIILVVTLGLRIAPYYKSTFTDKGPLIRDPDASYHLRRVELIVQNFPSIPLFDSYINHPHGAHIIWPPLYDLFLAALWSIISLVPGFFSPLQLLVFIPPLLMVVTCGVIYRMGLRLWPKRKWLACGAALIPALLPTTISYSYLGQLDHHAAEFLVMILFLDSLSRALARVTENRDLRKTIRVSLLPGLYLGLGLLVQHGLLFLEALIFLTLLAIYWKERKDVWGLGIAINAIACIVILPLGIFSHFQGVPLAHTHFGGFQPWVVAEATLFYTTLWLIMSRAKLSGKYRTSIISASVMMTLVVGVYLWRETVAGAQYVLGAWSGWQSHIGESQSLLSLPLSDVASQVSMQISWLVLILPVGWWLLYRQRRLLLLVATLMFVVMGSLQMRYLPYLALLLGLMVALAVEYLMDRWGKAVTGPVLALVISAGYYPSIQGIGEKDITYNLLTQLHPVLEWLRSNTPPTSHYENPTTPAEYGVLAEWSLGHYIQYYGHRPALADNFGEHASDLRRLREFFLARNNKTAWKILDENKVRYVLTRDLVGTFQSVVQENQVEQYVTGASLRGKSMRRINFSPEMFPTVLYRLTWRYGGAVMDRRGTYHPPLERLRLVAESPGKDEQTEGGPEIALVKLYEYVPGCQVEVSGLPSSGDVMIQGIVHTPYERWFPYIQLARSDSRGNLALTVPYSTDKDKGIPYIDRYTLRSGEESRLIRDITNDMVVHGKTIYLSW